MDKRVSTLHGVENSHGYVIAKRVLMGFFYVLPFWVLCFALVRAANRGVFTFYLLDIAIAVVGLISAGASAYFGFKIVFLLSNSAKITKTYDNTAKRVSLKEKK